LAFVNKFSAENPKSSISGIADEKLIQAYPKLDNDVQASFEIYSPEGEKPFFRLSIALRDDSKLKIIDKDVLFLIDISRSIDRYELESARDAILKYISTLPSSNRVNFAVFSEETIFWRRNFVNASEAKTKIEEIKKFIHKRQASRFTNVFDATQKVLHSLPPSSRMCNVYLISDGEATHGTDSVKRIVQGFERIQRQRFAIFTFNAGTGGNKYLLKLLSYRSRGIYLDEPEMENVSGSLHNMFKSFDRPVLSDAVINYTSLKADEVYPAVLPNLYHDMPIEIYGRAKGGEVITIRVAGIADGQMREIFFRTRVKKVGKASSEISRQWAQGKAHAMMAVLSQNPADSNLRQQIVALAEKYKLASTLELVKRKSLLSPLKSLLKRNKK
jgi:Ca-activated chloride channel family protein